MRSGIGLRTKALLGIMGIVVLLGLAVIIVVRPSLEQKLTVAFQKRGISIANHIALNSVNPVLTEQYLDLEMMLKDFKGSEDGIAYIFVLDNQGKLLAHTFENGFPLELIKVNKVASTQKYSLQPITAEKEEIVDIAVPLMKGAAGFVHIGLSNEHIRKDVASIIKLIVWLFIAILIVGSVMGNILSRIMTRPILELTEIAKAVGLGNLEQRVLIRSTDEIGELGTTFNHMIESRKRAEEALQESEEQIRASLIEKEVLLKEIHHRVKNNLQVVASMLELQAGFIKDKEAKVQFEESQKRVESMSLIHDKLYRTKDLARIDFREYVDDLVDNLLTLNAGRSKVIETKLDIEGVVLDVNNAIPCGLIINELVSNALRHAFPNGKDGEIIMHMRRNGEGMITLMLADNGVGFPADIDFRNTKSLGMQLVISLVKQLDGKIELDRSRGTSFNIAFRTKKEEKGDASPGE